MNGRSQAPTLHQVLARAHRRLILFSVSLAGAALLFCGAVMMHDYVSRGLVLVAHTVSYTVEPAIVFGDEDAIREGIVSVSQGGTAARIEVADPAGHVLAEWSRSEGGPIGRMEVWGSALLWPDPVTERIERNGAPIGEVRVYGSAAGIGHFLAIGLLVALCCVGIAAVATGMLARRLRSGVIDPLNHVAEVARSVRLERAFHRRVPGSGLAEVDNFVHDFNSLLIELQGWYAGLTQENQELARQATRDPLTGLGNRVLFARQLEQALIIAGKTGSCFALLYLDGDQFKQINDCHGHEVGDVALRTIAERLEQCLRAADAAFRLGGDEFAVILSPPIERDDIASVIARIREAMAAPIPIEDGGFVTMAVSVGFSICPDDGLTPADLVRTADEAMYRDKIRRRDDASDYSL